MPEIHSFGYFVALLPPTRGKTLVFPHMWLICGWLFTSKGMGLLGTQGLSCAKLYLLACLDIETIFLSIRNFLFFTFHSVPPTITIFNGGRRFGKSFAGSSSTEQFPVQLQIRERKKKSTNFIILNFFLQCNKYSLSKGNRFLFHFYLFYFLCILAILSIFPIDVCFLFLFLGYLFHPAMSEWGFCLALQQTLYYGLTLLFERSTPCALPFSAFVLLLLIQVIFGFEFFSTLYFEQYLKLLALLAGACMVFLSLERRATFTFFMAFFLYFLSSILLGFLLCPDYAARGGLWLFILLNLGFLGGLLKQTLNLSTQKLQGLTPWFFGCIFFLLNHLPALGILEKWIEGIDLLCLFFGILSFL